MHAYIIKPYADKKEGKNEVAYIIVHMCKSSGGYI